jgi:hypothetical protein
MRCVMAFYVRTAGALPFFVPAVYRDIARIQPAENGLNDFAEKRQIPLYDIASGYCSKNHYQPP